MRGSLTPQAPLKILVADDNVDAAASLCSLLQLAGHDTEVAHDGLQAYDKAAMHRPDVILLYIGMPRMDGYRTCRAIRSEPWGKDILMVAG